MICRYPRKVWQSSLILINLQLLHIFSNLNERQSEEKSSLIQDVCSKLNLRSGSDWRLETRTLLRAMVEAIVMLGKRVEASVMEHCLAQLLLVFIRNNILD